jgi:transposase InsO family protein
MDQASQFMPHQFHGFAQCLNIKLFSSSPYYAQANGQAESSNKTLIKLIKKKIEGSRKISKGGMKSYRKRYGHIASPSIALQGNTF